MGSMYSSYHPPTALTVISCIFLGLGAISFLVVAADIIWRRGWESMMRVMIPVYPINAAYNPLSVYIYFKYGRPIKPVSGQDAIKPCHASKDTSSNSKEKDVESLTPSPSLESPSPAHCHAKATTTPTTCCHSKTPSEEPAVGCHSKTLTTAKEPTPKCHTTARTRPFLATVLIGVSHCGAGCVLGDLIGEWLVYGTHTTISHADIWPCLLIDYAFALLFGIAFQYFSIAPMSGEWGPKTIWRAAKADIVSLTGFEVGAFGWMVAFQVGIWGGRLEMGTWVYWWMMQVGMCMGFATGVPVNWFLLKWGVKEPCC